MRLVVDANLVNLRINKLASRGFREQYKDDIESSLALPKI